MEKQKIFVSSVFNINQIQLGALANNADPQAKQILAVAQYYIKKLEEILCAHQPSSLTAVRISILNELAPSLGISPVIMKGEDSYIEVEAKEAVKQDTNDLEDGILNARLAEEAIEKQIDAQIAITEKTLGKPRKPLKNSA